MTRLRSRNVEARGLGLWRLHPEIGAALAILFVLAAATISAQRDPTPVRTPGAAPTASTAPAARGTGSLSGRLVADTSNTPVRRAIVTLSGSELGESVSAITDEQGRFAFTGLPAGRFVVTASKPAHLTTAYGARQPGRPGTAVSVGEGQDVRDISFVLRAGGVITGTVRNQFGEPLPGIAIIAGRPDIDRPGAGQSTSLGNLTTDDRGVYRVFGLEPGNYFVGAQVRFSQGALTMLAEREVTEALAALQRSAPAPGRSAPTALPANAPAGTVSLAPIFFPGTADFSQAQAIPLGLGEERTGVDIVLRPVPSVRISGTVSGPGGQTPSVQIGFVSDSGVALPGYGMAQPTLARAPGSDGRFTYTGVIPGRYTITARTAGPGRGSAPVVVGGGGGGSGRGGGGSAVPAAEQLWAVASVTVTDADVEGLSLSLTPTLRLSGRIEFDATTLTPPASPTDIRLAFAPRRDGGSGGSMMINGALFGSIPPPPAAVAPDRTFTFNGLMPGVFHLNSTWTGGMNGWWLRSAIADEVDILDVPLEIGLDARVPSSVVVTYSDRQTELSGVLQTAGGLPAPDYFIVAFSTDARTWRPQARRLASARPATDGAFFIRNLPPGEYYLAALTDLDPAEWQTPAFLGQLAPVSLKFTLTDGQKFRQDLRVQ